MIPPRDAWWAFTEALCSLRGHHFTWSHEPGNTGLRCRTCTLGRPR